MEQSEIEKIILAESPKKTYFGTITASRFSSIDTLDDAQMREVKALIQERLAGDTYQPRGNAAPTGEFYIGNVLNLLSRGKLTFPNRNSDARPQVESLSWHARKTRVRDCVKRYHQRVDIIGYGKLRSGPLFYRIDEHDGRMREAAFDEHLISLETELNADRCEDEAFRVSREVIRNCRTSTQYKQNFMTNAERCQMALTQLIEYVKGCVTFKSGHQEYFQDSEASIVRGMGLPWMTLSYKHESYEGDFRISLDKIQRIWNIAAHQTGVDDFCLWIDHVMRLKRFSTRDWYAVGIEPYSIAPVLRYLRKPYNISESMYDVNEGLWLSCEAILGISSKGLFCIREGSDVVEVIDSGLHVGAKAAVEILSLCFLNGRLFTKKVFYQEDSKGLVDWATGIAMADYAVEGADETTQLSELIQDMLSLESQTRIFNRIERHLGTFATRHLKSLHGEWRGIRGMLPSLVLWSRGVDSRFEDCRCKIYGCSACGKKISVLECFRDDTKAWKAITISGLDSDVTGPEGHVVVTMKLSPMESSMLSPGDTLDGLAQVGGGFLVICNNMRLLNEVRVGDIRWVPGDGDSDDEDGDNV